jgi:hypothetical protein
VNGEEMSGYHYHMSLKNGNNGLSSGYYAELTNWPLVVEGETVSFPDGVPTLLTRESNCPFKHTYLGHESLPSVEDPIPAWIYDAFVWGVDGIPLHYADLESSYGFTALTLIALSKSDVTVEY